jgi:hypothetical protein
MVDSMNPAALLASSLAVQPSPPPAAPAPARPAPQRDQRVGRRAKTDPN